MTNKLKEDWGHTFNCYYCAQSEGGCKKHREWVSSKLSSQREEIRGKLEGHMGSSKPIHSKDCIYQRYGCDCGYMEDVGYVDGLKAALSILQEMEGHER